MLVSCQAKFPVLSVSYSLLILKKLVQQGTVCAMFPASSDCILIKVVNCRARDQHLVDTRVVVSIVPSITTDTALHFPAYKLLSSTF